MKRAQKDLLRDKAEHQADEILRAQLEKEAGEERAAKRRKKQEEAFITKWNAALCKWDEIGLQSAHGFSVTLPAPNPPGASPFTSPTTLRFFTRTRGVIGCFINWAYSQRVRLSSDDDTAGNLDSAYGWH